MASQVLASVVAVLVRVWRQMLFGSGRVRMGWACCGGVGWTVFGERVLTWGIQLVG